MWCAGWGIIREVLHPRGPSAEAVAACKQQHQSRIALHVSEYCDIDTRWICGGRS